jgi:hypothetical protein
MINWKRLFCRHYAGFEYISEKKIGKDFCGTPKVNVLWKCPDCGKTIETTEKKSNKYVDFSLGRLHRE